MVFPIGAQVWELAADHLDRLPGKSLIDGLVHKRSMANDDQAAGANQPHDSEEGRREKTDRNRNYIQSRVQLRSGEAVLSNLEITAIKLADEPHTGNDEDDVEEQPRVGEQGVDAKHDEHDGIVAGEVAQVVVDAGLHLGEVLGLGEALEIEELGERAQVREAVSDRARTEVLETLAHVEARRQDVYGDLNSRHCGCCVGRVDEVVVGSRTAFRVPKLVLRESKNGFEQRKRVSVEVAVGGL